MGKLANFFADFLNHALESVRFELKYRMKQQTPVDSDRGTNFTALA
jgi:hypothetical protein